jgi:tryptophanyl-tRNA synthetase
MAADILGPRATLIPVGSDQKIHVRLAGDLANHFNDEYGTYFPIPQTIVHMVKVPGLDGKKMSKTSELDNSIDIHSAPEEILKRYLELGITDENRKLVSDPGDPYHGCKSVYAVHELVTEGEVTSREIATRCQNAQIGCVECKHRLVESIWKRLGPFQEKRATIKNADVIELLHEGGKKARKIVQETVGVVRERMGVRIH